MSSEIKGALWVTLEEGRVMRGVVEINGEKHHIAVKRNRKKTMRQPDYRIEGDKRE